MNRRGLPERMEMAQRAPPGRNRERGPVIYEETRKSGRMMCRNRVPSRTCFAGPALRMRTGRAVAPSLPQYRRSDRDARCFQSWSIDPASHRSGLLTYEHQGCPKFEQDTARIRE